MPNPKRLDPKEIIAEVQQLGGEIEQRLSRIYELSDTLYSSVRHGHFRQERERLDQDLRLVRDRLERAARREESPELIAQLTNTVREIERQLDAHGEIVPVYTMFANAWKRLAGTMHQGLRRTASVDRVVHQVQRKHGVSEITEVRQQPPSPPPTQGMGVEDLVELYGEETVNGHASER
jgi:uncharacterized membrane protein YccC